MPVGIFLGRPWPAPGEPLWHDEDTDLAIALDVSRDGVCDRCGTHRDEWVDPSTGRDFRVPPYVARESQCPGCHVIHLAEQGVPKARRQTTRIVLVPNPDAPRRLPTSLEPLPPPADGDDLADDDDVT